MGGEFLPILEEGDLAMQMTIPPGSSLSQSVLQTTRAEKILLENFPEVEQVISKIGTAEVPTDPMAVEDADIMIVLKDKKEWVSAKIREDLIEKMKEELSVITAASFEFTQPIQLRFNELMTGVKTDIAVKIYGEDIDELYHQANRAAGIIESLPGASDVRVEQISGLPQYVIRYDRQKIAKYGMNIQELNAAVRTAYAGETAGVVFEGERRFDLVVRMDSSYRKEMDLSRLYVRSYTGNPIPISEVATVEYVEGPLQIARDDTKRRVTIGINVRNRDVKSLVWEINQELSEKLELKAGYYLTYGGQFENLENALGRLKVLVPIALVLILILLFFTFNSVKYALLIFSAVPLSAVGGILALWIRGMPFSISAGVGFIALFGVAVLNGIVLISYYNDLRKEGVRNIKYIVIKGACTRLRPVLMTAVTDILGFLPMALSVSAGAEVQRPLATVVIGGLITSTMLTLIILPILYSLMNRSQLQDINPRKDTPRFKLGRMNRPGKGKINPMLLSVLMVFVLLLVQGPAARYASAQEALSSEANPGARVLTQNEAIRIARENNLVLRNAELELESAEAGRKGIVDLNPTEFRYTYGQINTGADDRFLEIEQNFGSIVSHIQRSGFVKQQIEALQSNVLLTEAGLDRRVKTLYQFWVYHHSLFGVIQREKLFYEQLLEVANARFGSGESSLLEKSLVETRYAGILNEWKEAERNLLDSESLLKQVLQVSDTLRPPESGLERYQLLVPSMPAEKSLVESYYEDLYKLEQANLKLEKSRFFPGLSAGYFNQSIDRMTGFSGFMVGMTFPIWFVPQGGRISQARIQADIAHNELLSQIHRQKLQRENLQEQLQNYDQQLSYYEETAVKSAETLMNTATLQFEKQAIEYFEYIQSISVALDIHRAYLDQLSRYNQTAIELEYLMK
jgi:cobalt-zinc-cadmium resistance protein CzcA